MIKVSGGAPSVVAAVSGRDQQITAGGTFQPWVFEVRDSKGAPTIPSTVKVNSGGLSGVSYTQSGAKKSLNIEIDYTNATSRVRGYSDARRDRFRHRLTDDAGRLIGTHGFYVDVTPTAAMTRTSLPCTGWGSLRRRIASQATPPTTTSKRTALARAARMVVLRSP